MDRVDQYLFDKLNERALAGNLRQLKTNRAPADLFSNDYLGLATTGALTVGHDTVQGPMYTGATGSRLLSGNSVQAEELEHTIAAFHNAEAALLFNSGYDANVGLLASVASRDATILSDDGIRLSQCSRKYKFRHNDVNDLEDKLKRHTAAGPILVVVESVYSMDGDMAPLQDIARLCETYNARLIVDEAHATGVFGSHGEGLVCQLGLQDKVFARTHTFGKALGCHGAAIAGSDLLKQYLINFARSFIYTTALPGHSVQAIALAYQYLSSADFTNRQLHELISYFREQIKAPGTAGWKESTSAIQAIVIGDNEHSKLLASKLQQAGLQVNPILHPTVPLGMERLRICLHTFNTKEQVDLLFEIIKFA
jgi:8-amino-7-oxononanoate synthase